MSTPASPSSSSPSPRPHAVDWARREGAVDEVLGELAACGARSRRRKIWSATGAAVALAVMVFVFRSSLSLSPTITAPPSKGILVSQPARQVLPDGSLVELKPGAEIAVAFSKDGVGPRKILLRKGEAHFAVAKDAQRPFIVAAGRVEVRAIGTAFAVGLDPGQVEIIVTEGRVAVDRAAVAPATPATGIAPSELTFATIDAGNRLIVPSERPTAEPAVQAISEPELTERLAWRIPQLEFSGTRLADAVAMFNQHNETKFVLADHTLDALQVSGYLRADKTETFILLLETNFGLKAEHLGREIVLRRP